nr:hypothetical protein Iba_chr02aCG22250 [Ipomoea batatas]
MAGGVKRLCGGGYLHHRRRVCEENVKGARAAVNGIDSRRQSPWSQNAPAIAAPFMSRGRALENVLIVALKPVGYAFRGTIDDMSALVILLDRFIELLMKILIPEVHW